MKSKKLAIAGGLLVLLLVLAGIVAGCNSSANPMEDISSGDKKEDVNPSSKVTKEYINPSGKREPGTININGEEFSVSDIPGYPEGPPIANGIVRKVTSTTLDLESPTGEMSSVTVENGETHYTDTETKITQIIFNRDTKVYKQVPRIGAKPPIELHESSINDVSEGQQIAVWGEESGSNRILAAVIIFM